MHGLPLFNAKGNLAFFTLNEALRFTGPGPDKPIHNIPAGVTLSKLAISDFGDSPDITDQAEFERRLGASAPYGGTFASLAAKWWSERDPKRFKDADEARGSLPPSLIGQGERTQPNWLNDFLLNPTPVRRIVLLRMPKFNMSDDEAKTLVKYFAAVTRQTNPGIGLAVPFDHIASRQDDYWRDMNKQYIARLKKDNLLEARLKSYGPVFKQVRSQFEPVFDKKIEQIDQSVKKATADREELEKQRDKLKESKDEKDKAKLTDLNIQINIAEGYLKDMAVEKKKIEIAKRELEESNQEKAWIESDAYAADAYRLLTSRDLCGKCHQIGTTPAKSASATDKQGPPLDLASKRLRPDWIERWVDNPQRFVHYPSMMPSYFVTNQSKYQELLAGQAPVQIHALSDVLLNYPRIWSLPINRVHNPDLK
jgi:hypothetical protein